MANNTDKSLASAQKDFTSQLKKDGKASATILAYNKDIQQLIEFLQKKQITQVTSINKDHLNDFKEYLADNQYIPKSVSRKLNSIKTFCRFLMEKGLIGEDPALAVAHPKYELKAPRVLSKMEYRALRDAARNDVRMAAVIELLLQTGMRIGELARLGLENVDNKGIKIEAYESHSERNIPLNEAVKKSLDRYLNIRSETNNKSLFVTKTGRPLLVRNIRSAIIRYFRIAGIEDAKVNDLRHTFITHQLTRGTSVTLVQELVGHKRLSTTEKYLNLVKGKVDSSVKVEEL